VVGVGEEGRELRGGGEDAIVEALDELRAARRDKIKTLFADRHS
jgi:hypothetical protein